MDSKDIWEFIKESNKNRDFAAEKREREEKIAKRVQSFEVERSVWDKSETVWHTIKLKVKENHEANSDIIAIMEIFEHKNAPINRFLMHRKDESVVPHMLYIKRVHVFSEYQKHGLSKALYREFGKLYAEKWMGLPTAFIFNNPLADYGFWKAVECGDIPKEAYCPEYIDRLYDNWQEALVEELKQKAPALYPLPASAYIRMIVPEEKKA